MAEYQGGFISHCVSGLLGPEGEAAEPVSGFLIIAFNGVLYCWIVQNSRKLVKEKNHTLKYACCRFLILPHLRSSVAKGRTRAGPSQGSYHCSLSII